MGHYKGVDQRVRDLFVTDEILLEIMCFLWRAVTAVFCDAIIRLIREYLETKPCFDRFFSRQSCPPIYTRPADYKGNKVPDILRLEILQSRGMREKQAEERTKKLRPDLL